MNKNLTTKFLITMVAFAGGILLTRYLRKSREEKNTGVVTPTDESLITGTTFTEEPTTPPLNFSGNVSGTSYVILDTIS